MGEAAFGWRLAVYWKSDQAFHEGTVMGFDASMGRHHVVYTDGDEERLHLGNEHIKWLSPPEGVSLGVQVRASLPTWHRKPNPALIGFTSGCARLAVSR